MQQVIPLEDRKVLLVDLDGRPIHSDDLGGKYSIKGVIYERGNEGIDLLLFLPNRKKARRELVYTPTRQEWKEILWFGDRGAIELTDISGRVVKAIVSKSRRRIEEEIRWKVFNRDGFVCQYCGISGVPLTVDHYVPWEKGGRTVEENLKTCCRECNGLKGNMLPEEWEALCSNLKEEQK